MEPSIEQQEVYISIWAKVVDTQMHFNEMAVKSRQFGLGFVAAALGLGIVLLVRKEDFSLAVHLLGGFYIHTTVVIAFASAMALYAVKILDLHVYHKMLRGAVTFGEDFEENYMKKIFNLEKGMTQAISHFSRFDDASVTRASNGKYEFQGINRRSALIKIERFYKVSITTLCIVGLVLFLATGSFGNIKEAGQPSAVTPAVEKAH